MGNGTMPGAHLNSSNLGIGEALFSAWWAGAHLLGVRVVVWIQYLLPVVLSLHQSQPGCVCGICRSSGWRPSWQPSSYKVRVPSRHKVNPKKPSSISGPLARHREFLSLFPKPEAGTAPFGDLRDSISAGFTCDELRLSVWGSATTVALSHPLMTAKAGE